MLVLLFVLSWFLSAGVSSISLRSGNDEVKQDNVADIVQVTVQEKDDKDADNIDISQQISSGDHIGTTNDVIVTGDGKSNKLRRVPAANSTKCCVGTERFRKIWSCLPKITLFLTLLMLGFHYSLVSTAAGAGGEDGYIGRVNSDKFAGLVVDEDPIFFVKTLHKNIYFSELLNMNLIRRTYEVETFGLDAYCSKYPGFCEDFIGMKTFYRPITSTLAHLDYDHLLTNMRTFLLVGSLVEKTHSPSAFLSIMLSSAVGAKSWKVLFDTGFRTYAEKLKQVIADAPNSDISRIFKDASKEFVRTLTQGRHATQEADSWTKVAGLGGSIGFSGVLYGLQGAIFVAAVLNFRSSSLAQHLKKYVVNKLIGTSDAKNWAYGKGLFSNSIIELSIWSCLIEFVVKSFSNGNLFEERSNYNDALRLVTETVPYWGHFGGLMGGAVAALAAGPNIELENDDVDESDKSRSFGKAKKMFSVLLGVTSVVGHGFFSALLFEKHQTVLFTYAVVASAFVFWHFCTFLRRAFFVTSQLIDSKEVVPGREGAKGAPPADSNDPGQVSLPGDSTLPVDTVTGEQKLDDLV